MSEDNRKSDDASDTDTYSSEDNLTYVPQCVTNDLEVDEHVYELLENIRVDWPGQSFTFINSFDVILATNPPAGKTPSFINVEFSRTENFQSPGNLTLNSFNTDFSFNRIIYDNKRLACVSDESYVVYNDGLDVVQQVDGNFSYGLFCTSTESYTGLKEGSILIISQKNKKSVKIHDKGIESIYVEENQVAYTGACDGYLRVFDLRCNAIVNEIDNGSDVNALDVYGTNIAFGDDNGLVFVADTRNIDNVERMEWHKSPISCVKWRNATEFVTASDEQIAFWDIDIERGCSKHEEFPDFLTFVHQGDRFYKEVKFCPANSDVCVATSIDGMVFFKLNPDL